MKKYLMTGVAALAFAATFTSCSKSGDLYDESKVNEQKEKNITESYAAAFEKAFGKVGSNVDWGFSSKSTTRTADTNSNEWVQKGYNVPSAITAREQEVVMNWFRTHENPQSETVDLHNYFIQNVGYTDHTYPGEGVELKDNNGHNVTITNPGRTQMDYIFVGPGAEATAWNDPTPKPITWNDGDDHVNNFNANSGEIQHMMYSGSEWFGFHDSYGNGYSTAGHGNNGKYCEVNRNFVIRFIDVDGVVGCYVGFNYESGKTSEGWHLEPDGFFDDRVIKLVAAEGEIVPPTPTPKYRVIAEDLSASEAGDFDFNDVVFDVISYDQSTDKTTLRLQACGGTLPLKVGGHEVHKLYGEDGPDATTGKYKMWNTGRESHDPVDFTVNGDYTTPGSLLNLVIEVEKEGVWVPLTAQRGVAACKILVDDRFGIVPERQSIANKYGNFTTYVQGNWKDENEQFWWIQTGN